MDALGRLAGSLAHDLNNILGAIEGYATLLLNAMPPDSSARPDLEEILKAERRAAALTKQLMVFSRRSGGQKTAVNLSELLAGLAQKAKPLVGESIALEISAAADLKPVKADPAMLEQALLNLVLNARDAMPGGGRITLAAGKADLGGAEPQCPRPAEPNTEFVEISVSDGGAGITPENMDRLFEPFFTTKPKGKAAGMGLSAVYGIIAQHNGWTAVSSEVGKGSVFTVYLPQA
jgi:signal transduction histidine kinase